MIFDHLGLGIFFAAGTNKENILGFAITFYLPRCMF